MAENTPIYGLRPSSLRLLAVLTLLALGAAVVFSALGVQRLPGMSGTVFRDFDLFHSVARLTLEGRLSDVYDFDAFREAQGDLGGPVHQMTWTYPPPFDLVLAPLGRMGLDVAYLVFTVCSFALYILTLRLVAGRYFTLALLAAVPATLVTLRTGQNGCLMAALAALVCHMVVTARPVGAGAMLGLMVIKPHVGLGLGIWSVLSLRWRMAFAALIVVAGVVLLSVGVLGLDVWRAFLGATGEASALLVEGRYPHFRMASAYSTFRSLGSSAELALAAQITAAVIGLGAIFLAATKLGKRAGDVGGLVHGADVQPLYVRLRPCGLRAGLCAAAAGTGSRGSADSDPTRVIPCMDRGRDRLGAEHAGRCRGNRCANQFCRGGGSGAGRLRSRPVLADPPGLNVWLLQNRATGRICQSTAALRLPPPRLHRKITRARWPVFLCLNP